MWHSTQVAFGSKPRQKISLSSLSLAHSCNWRDTRGNLPLALNPDRNYIIIPLAIYREMWLRWHSRQVVLALNPDRNHLIIPLPFSERGESRHTRGKWPLALNPDRNHLISLSSADWRDTRSKWPLALNPNRNHIIISLIISRDITDVTFGASDLWLGTWTWTGGTATLA